MLHWVPSLSIALNCNWCAPWLTVTLRKFTFIPMTYCDSQKVHIYPHDLPWLSESSHWSPWLTVTLWKFTLIPLTYRDSLKVNIDPRDLPWLSESWHWYPRLTVTLRKLTCDLPWLSESWPVTYRDSQKVDTETRRILPNTDTGSHLRPGHNFLHYDMDPTDTLL